MGRRTVLDTIKKWMLGTVEMLVALPFLIYLFISFVQTGSVYNWLGIHILLYLAGILLYYVLPTKKRWVFTILSIIGAVFSAYLFADSTSGMVITGLLTLFVLNRGISAARAPAGDTFSEFFLLSGFFIYFAAFFFYRGIESLQPFADLITWTGIGIVLFTLFHANQEFLRGATLSNNRKPYIQRVVKTRNAVAVAFIVIVAFLITGARYVESFFAAVLGYISSLLTREATENADTNTPVMEDMAPDLGFEGDVGEPSRLMVMLETILMYAVGIVMIVAAFFLIFILFKRVRRQFSTVIKWLSDALSKIGGASEEEEEPPYVDEKESLRDWNTWKNNNNTRIKSIFTKRFQKETTIDDFETKSEKIKFLYRRAVATKRKEGYHFRESATPLETMRELIAEERFLQDLSELELAELYSQVRYGNGEISDEQFDSVFDKKVSN